MKRGHQQRHSFIQIENDLFDIVENFKSQTMTPKIMNFRSSNLLRSANQETTSNSDSNESEYSNPFDLNGG